MNQRIRCAALVRTVLEIGTRLKDVQRSLPFALSRETLQEIYHRSIDVRSPLLLGPVATARQHYHSAQLWNKFSHVKNALSHARKAQYNIIFTGDIERSEGNLCTGKGSKKFPVPVDITVAVETAPKSCAREFGNIEIDIDF